jgi:hypothetical protein
MSLLTTASPYHSREDGSGNKGGKKSSNRRKATMPSLSTSVSGAKNYMSQLIQNKEPQPSLSSYNGTPINEFYSYQPSGISNMLYPTLEDTSSKNLPHEKKEGVIEDPLQGEELLEKNGALPPAEIPSFYKKNKTHQSGITSALQKLTGSKTITQEGMTDYGDVDDSNLDSTYSSSKANTIQQKQFDTPYIPTMPAFTMNQTPNEDEDNENTYSASPIDYLRSSPSSPTMFSDYLSSYSSSNYVVPPNLSQYSYPTMRPSTKASEIEQMFSMDSASTIEGDRTQQILLEKINYMIYLLEQQKKEKNKHTTEEFVLYSFLGVFVIYIADSFARSGRYIR